MSSKANDQIDPVSKCVAEYLGQNYFVIPSNQREYRWRTEQVEQLWSDTLNMIANGGHYNDKAKGHFLGAVVVIGSSNVSPEAPLQIIDGQQRLTTMLIFAASLLSHIDEIKDNRARKYLTSALNNTIFSPYAGGKPRLALNRESDFFQELLFCDDFAERERFFEKNYSKNSEVQTNIKHTFEIFERNICNYLNKLSSETERSDAFLTLVEEYIDGLYVLVVRTKNSWMAYKLFETLNARGLDLTQADLIKNILLEQARVQNEENGVIQQWEILLDNFESQSDMRLNLPQIIQFSYSYRYSDKFVKKDDIYDEISTALHKGIFLPKQLVNDFVYDSQLWNNFLQGDLSQWGRGHGLADAHYAILHPLWKEHCTPFILAAMNRFSDDIEELNKCLIACENYLFRQGVVVRDSVANLQSTFTTASKLLNTTTDLSDVFSFFKTKSPDQQFVDAFKVFKVKNIKQAFYVLWKIEVAAAGGVEFRPKDHNALQHVEHILPKNPGGGWSISSDNEDFKGALNRLGNLLILESTKNQKIRNNSIQYKIANGYLLSDLSLPKQIDDAKLKFLDNNEWTLKSINKRQVYLADTYALAVWGLECNS